MQRKSRKSTKTLPPRLTQVSLARRKVLFTVQAAPGSRVYLVGSFNGWDTTCNPMHDREGNGTFTLQKFLPTGHHEYKFYINGEWTPDSANPNTILTELGTLNSVLEL
jgi:5'-AMP-activated protein kinase regulatory beta subunit